MHVTIASKCNVVQPGYNLDTTARCKWGPKCWGCFVFIRFSSVLCCSKFSHPPGSAGHIKCRGRYCTCVVALTHDANTEKDTFFQKHWGQQPGWQCRAENLLISQFNCSSECSRSRFFRFLLSFFKALANSCLITVSTVPISTSKCLLLPLLQLPCGMRYCEGGTETTTHNIWQQYSGCAEKRPFYSKLQP